jgi:hypothetical protein
MAGSIVAEQIVFTLARLAGLTAAALSTALYGKLLFFDAYTREVVDAGTYKACGAMVLLACLGMWGVMRGQPVPVLLAFLGSFFPVGLYFLGTPGIYAWIGVLDVLYLVAGALLVLYRTLLTLQRTEERLR